MRGHEDIIRMRRAGEAPSIIHIETAEGFDRFGSGTRFPFGADQPHVHIRPDEAVHRLDMRFVVGLFVKVAGMDAERVKATVAACIKAKASRVIGVTHRRVGDGEFTTLPTTEVTDTEGVMTWRE